MPLCRSITFIIVFLAMTGCSQSVRVLPKPVPREAIAHAAQDASSDPIFETSNTVPEEWWTIFNDPQLTEFITIALKENPTLKTAQARIFLAAKQADMVRSTLYPSLFWNADVNREKLSKTGVIPFGSSQTGTTTAVPVNPGAASGIPVYFTLYETEFTLKYEFDFWNKNKNTLRAALGQMQAQVAETAFAKLQLSISVAQVYFALQINYKRELVAQNWVKIRSEYKDLIEKRIKANVDNAISLQLAEAVLSDATQLLLSIQGESAVYEHQLKAYLAGDFNEVILNTKVVDQPLPKVPLPNNLPLHLIARRPDITAQLWVIESAGRQIEVAKAGFYPDFNITAFYGYQTIHFRELFKWPSSYFNIDPAVSLPIFDGGRLLANLEGSEVQYDLEILKYNDLVINATREVLDGIAVLRNRVQQLEDLKKKTLAQESIAKLNNLRLTHNIATSLTTIDSQGYILEAQDREMVAEGNAIQAILSLIKALGGGYDTCYEG